jgi:hypothetical protein
VVLVTIHKIFLTNATPALRATPPLLRRGFFDADLQYFHTLIGCTYVCELGIVVLFCTLVFIIGNSLSVG